LDINNGARQPFAVLRLECEEEDEDENNCKHDSLSDFLRHTCCLVLLSGTIGVTAGQQRAGRGSTNQLAQQSNNDAAATLFRSGRDLITDQEWAKRRRSLIS
jgi:hypothetical protein